MLVFFKKLRIVYSNNFFNFLEMKLATRTYSTVAYLRRIFEMRAYINRGISPIPAQTPQKTGNSIICVEYYIKIDVAVYSVTNII